MEKAALKMKTTVLSSIRKMPDWVRKNRAESVCLLAILLTGGFLRIYKIAQYMTFLGDEGRDAIVVRRLLVNFDPILIGPGTSVGDMYLGPLYYYLIAPSLALANFSPVGPSVFVALVGVATIFLVWLIAREWFGKVPAFWAALLYAVSPVVIIYSRSSWNPNVMPFFSLLIIYSLWQVWKRHRFSWLIVTGIFLAFALQSHYLALILIPTIGLFWLLTFVKLRKDHTDRKNFLTFSMVLFIFLLLLMSPLVIFDARHGWRNFSSMGKIFAENEGSVSLSAPAIAGRIWPVWQNMVTVTLAAKISAVGKLLTFILTGGFLAAFWKRGKIGKQTLSAMVLVSAWIIISVIGLTLYRHEVYDHYMGFVFPAPFLLIAGIVAIVEGSFVKIPKHLIRTLAIIAFSLLVILNLKENPLKHPPSGQLQRSENVARKIIQESGGERLNLAVIAERNYEGAYQYFLENWNAPFVMIDPQRYEETLAGQLFVVCEYEDRGKCQPTSNPKTEVANFGWSKIDKQWELSGVILYKLVPNRP